MKRVFKSSLKFLFRPFWRMTAPVRRMVLLKFDAHLTRSIANVVHGPFEHVATRINACATALERIETSVNVGRHTVEHQHAEANLLLDGLVREIARLQMQIELLRDAVDESGSQGSLVVVGEGDEAAKRRAS